MKKFLKIFCVSIISLLILVYGGVFLGHRVLFTEDFSSVPTIEAVSDGVFTFGVRPNHPTTVEAFIPILAAQLQRYNEVAPTLWPDNEVVNQSLIVEDIRNEDFWHISPDGVYTTLSVEEALRFGFHRNNYVDGFSFFDGGMYYAIAEEDLV